MAVPATAVYNAGVATTPDGAVYVQHTSGALIDSPIFTGTVTNSGRELLADGSVSAPSISFSNETNTGWYRNAATQQTLAIGGNAVLRFVGNTNMVFGSAMMIAWTSTDALGTVDTTLARGAAGIIKFASANSFSANGSVATSITSVGPTGANTTVQEWLTIKNASGTTRYIPCF